MPDLDMSDVFADAEQMHRQFLQDMYNDLDRRPTPEVEKLRYMVGILAREGNYYAIDATVALNYIMLMRVTETICEGCRNQDGCDMCCPPDFDYYFGGPDQDAHFERFGRPALPNEY